MQAAKASYWPGGIATAADACAKGCRAAMHAFGCRDFGFFVW